MHSCMHYSHILPHLLAEDVGLEEVEDGARLVGRHELVEDRAEEQVKAARHHAELDADPRDHLVVRLH